MWEPREPRTIIEAAERAAASNNYASAEELLREAARLQEASLGASHPDLAETLNNLGIVCEITNKPDDAEQCFRRAVAIATTALDRDHPFVATSRKNLQDFCAARGKRVDLPSPVDVPPPAAKLPAAKLPAPQAKAVKAEAPAPPPVEPPPRLVAPPPRLVAPPSRSVAPPRESHVPPKPNDARHENVHDEQHDEQQDSRTIFRRFALGALGPIAMLMVVLAVGLPRLGSTGRGELAPPTVSTEPLETPAAPPAAVPFEPTPVAEETPPSDGVVDEPPVRETTPAATVAKETVPAGTPTIIRAQLCASLDDWHCDPPDDPVPPGWLFFYTQIKSARAMTVQHRWYQGNRLHQAVDLLVNANPGAGYRTFSRTTIKADSSGGWRVELRTEDGVLLHEERFTVQ